MKHRLLFDEARPGPWGRNAKREKFEPRAFLNISWNVGGLRAPKTVGGDSPGFDALSPGTRIFFTHTPHVITPSPLPLPSLGMQLGPVIRLFASMRSHMIPH